MTLKRGKLRVAQEIVVFRDLKDATEYDQNSSDAIFSNNDYMRLDNED